MYGKLIIPFLILITSIILARLIVSNSVRNLSLELKAQLIELKDKSKYFQIGLVLTLFIGVLLANKIELFSWFLKSGLLITILVLVLLLRIYLTYIKLKKANYPNSYIQSVLFANALILFGILIYLVYIQ